MRIIAFALILALASCGEPRTVAAPPIDGAPLGMARLGSVDPGRRSWDETAPRPIATTIWYEAQPGARAGEILVPNENPVFTGGWAARNAAPAPGKRPLIVLSHETGGAAFQMMWLARRLVAAGYVVAAVDHHGNTAAEGAYDPRGFLLPAERARDLSVVIDRLLEDPVYGLLIDPARIGAAGFSLGGHTAMTLAGARTSLEVFEKFCASKDADATCQPQPEFPSARVEFEAMLRDDAPLRDRLKVQEGDFTESRIRSVVVIAPALAQALTDDSLARIAVPVAVIGAAGDEIAPIATNAGRIAAKVTGAGLSTIAGAAHFSFLNECTPRGRRFVPVCKDDGGTRSAIHDDAARMAIQHFENALGAGAR